MTTKITVTPYGHNVEVVITENGVETIQTPDPFGSTDYSVYDTKTITVREVEGWADKPTYSDATQILLDNYKSQAWLSPNTSGNTSGNTFLNDAINNITIRFMEKNEDELFAKGVMKTAIKYDAGNVIPAISSKLSVIWTTDFSNESKDEIIEAIVDELYAEYKIKLAQNDDKTIYPYILIATRGLTIDPTTFEPIISFLTSYGIG